MSNQSRRTFLKSTAAASILASLPLKARANPLGLPIGCQTWPVRQSIAKDFPGTIKTLAFNIKARLVPTDESTNDKAPDLRVLVGNVEIGAAWRRTSKENTEYHSVKLDDPSFPAPIYANLFKGETDYTLVWSR